MLFLDWGGVQLTIYGDGSEREKLVDYCEKNMLDQIVFVGTQKNSEIPRLLGEHDVLILPSLYDGWGAVVNEALTVGLYVICSDKCGARELISDERCGVVFKAGNVGELQTRIMQCIEHREFIRNYRLYRRERAKKCISGEVVARYMVDCLTGIERVKPWGV